VIQPHDSVLVQTLGRILIPWIQLFGLYVLFFGQYGPGGGFVGGVLLGTSVILAILVFGPESSHSAIAKKIIHGDGLGLIIFAGVGGLCLIGGGEFLNYADLEIPGMETSSRRYVGILLTQIGVAIDVAVTAISIVISLSFNDNDEDSHA